MDWNHYRFRSRWPLPAPAPDVYRALERIEDYPRWWPQVREVTRLDDTSGLLRFRSLLPYDLTATVREQRRDPTEGVLEVAMSGDMEGWARWTVAPRGSASSSATTRRSSSASRCCAASPYRDGRCSGPTTAS